MAKPAPLRKLARMNQPATQSPPQHAAVLLAAGRSKRLGQPKQTLEIDGQSLELRALRLAAQTLPAQLLLVRASDDPRPSPELPGSSIQLVSAPPGGMGRSLRAGIEAADEAIDGYLLLTVDMPYLDLDHLQALLRRWQQQPAQPVASAYADTVGIPALLPRSWRQRLCQLEPDQGARQWLRQRTRLATIRNPALAFDIDTPADLARLRGGGVD